MSTLQSRALPFSTRVLGEVMEDVLLLERGYRVIVFVDPYDIVDFCFPVGLRSTTKRTPDSIADVQAGYWEVFFNSRDLPILLQEYVPETRRIGAYLNYQAERAFSTVETMRQIADAQPEHAWSEDEFTMPEQTVLIAERDFSVALAATMGIFSSGVERYLDVTERRVVKESDQAVPKIVRKLLGEYEETTLVDYICRCLVSDDASMGSGERPLEQQQRVRSARADAVAVDKLLYLNGAMNRLSQKGEIEIPYIFLYLSSARRNEVIFQLPEVRRRLPSIQGKKFGIWRTVDHFITYVLHQDPDSEEQGLATRLEALRNTWQTVAQLEAVESSLGGMTAHGCDDCVLVGGSNHHCERRSLCEALRQHTESIRALHKGKANLTLSRNIKRYEGVLRRAEQLVEISSTQRYRSYVALLRNVLNDAAFKDTALERMRVLEKLAQFRTEFVNEIPGSNRFPEVSGPYRTTELITVPVQHLPTKTRITSPQYAAIAEMLYRFYTAPNAMRLETRTLFDEAYARYLALERETTELSGEHELIRCLLYLGLLTPGADERALDHSLKMSGAYADIEKEFVYLACWAARRVGQYQLGEMLARQALVDGPDPRFFHALALNTYAWNVKEKNNRRRHLADAVSYAKKAVELYRNWPGDHADVIGANLHNIAFFLVADTNDPVFDVVGARAALEALKEIVPKEQWMPQFPEYHQAEALIEYHEVNYLIRCGADRQDVCQKLAYAWKDMRLALDALEKPGFPELRERIIALQKRFGCLDG
jgi:hypothetical protein